MAKQGKDNNNPCSVVAGKGMDMRHFVERFNFHCGQMEAETEGKLATRIVDAFKNKVKAHIPDLTMLEKIVCENVEIDSENNWIEFERRIKIRALKADLRSKFPNDYFAQFNTNSRQDHSVNFKIVALRKTLSDDAKKFGKQDINFNTAYTHWLELCDEYNKSNDRCDELFLKHLLNLYRTWLPSLWNIFMRIDQFKDCSITYVIDTIAVGNIFGINPFKQRFAELCTNNSEISSECKTENVFKDNYSFVTTYIFKSANIGSFFGEFLKGKRNFDRGDGKFLKEVIKRAILCWLYENSDKSENYKSFLLELCPTRSEVIEWSFAEYVCAPKQGAEPKLSDFEKSLLGAIERSISSPIEENEDPNDINLFPQTKWVVESTPPCSIPLINDIQESCKGKNDKVEAAKRISELVKLGDRIPLDFIEYMPENIQDKKVTDILTETLDKAQKVLIDRLKNDIYYAHLIDDRKYTSKEIAELIKKSIQNHTGLNTQVSEMGQRIIRTIQKEYRSAGTELQKTSTEYDLLYALMKLAWAKIAPEIKTSAKVDVTVPKEKERLDFLRKCRFIDDQDNFMSKEVALVCFALYLSRDTTELSWGDVLDSFTNKISISENDHVKAVSVDFLTFGAVYVLALPPVQKEQIINDMCDYINPKKNRVACQSIIILLNTLLIQRDLNVSSELLRKMIDTTFNRQLYPHQLTTLAPLNDNPFCKNVLKERFENLSDPHVKKGQFPSPFFMYLHAAIQASNDQNQNFLHVSQENVIELTDENPLDIESLYQTCILLEASSWRLSNTSVSKKYSFSDSTIKTILNGLYDYWEKIVRANDVVANDDLLKATWAGQLFLTTYANLVRLDSIRALSETETQKLTAIALMSDWSQRSFNEGYSNYLKDPKSTDFWLISGALRVSSVQSLEKRTPPEAIAKFIKANQAIYIGALEAEINAENWRFYMLLCRFLEYNTDFFDAQDEKIACLKPTAEICGQCISKSKDWFLSYDNIQTYLKKKYSIIYHDRRMVKMKIVDINNLINGGTDIYDEMTATPYSIDYSWEHCHGAFLKIKNKYNNPQNDMTSDEINFLCLSLGWYLASWGMLRNSFLNEYSHEIHKDAIQLIYDHRWNSLWDIDYATLTRDQADLIQNLAKELEDTYKNIHHFERDDYQLTDTLKTKILLGTIACIPAYDRFFVCALRHSLDKTNLCAESLLELREVYITYRNEFASMKAHCNHGKYPSAKLLDMCFFKYGVELSKIEEEFKKIIKSHIPNFNSRNEKGRNTTNLVCLYVMHGNLVKSVAELSKLYNQNPTIYDSIQRDVLSRL